MAYGFGAASFASGATDAFGRLRVSNPVTQFEAKFTYGNEERLFNTTTATGGVAAFLPNEAAWNLTTTATSGSRVLRESWRYFQYHTGKGQEIILTGLFGAAVANCTKRIGYYDDNDGLFFVQNGTTGFGVCRRTSTSGSPADNVVYQAAWSIDKMDGTGPSGITLDVTKTNIFFIDFQWLGVGSVRFGVDIGGALYYVHQMDHANTALTQVYMKSAWLPVRYEIVNTGTSTASSLKQICATVMSEGGIEETGAPYSVGETQISTATTGAWVPIVSIKVGTTQNGYPYRGVAKLTGMDSVNTSANYAILAVFENATLTGPSWIAVPGGSSACSYDISATALTGGIQRATFYSARTISSNAIADANLVAPAGTTFTIAARGIGGSATLCASMNWREVD